MNKQEFEQFWSKCILPTFEEFAKVDKGLYIRDGSLDSLCRTYNDIKNCTKRAFMKKDDTVVKLDRHKIAACMVKAIVFERPIGKRIEDDYTGKADDFVIANEALAFSVATSIIKAYIKLKLEKQDSNYVNRERAYKKICEEDFCFPETIMTVDYKTSVCWAWHHNIINGHFDVLGTANLFFMIENYSVEAYSNN